MVSQTDLASFATWFVASVVGHVLLRLAWGAAAPKVIGKAKWVRAPPVSSPHPNVFFSDPLHADIDALRR